MDSLVWSPPQRYRDIYISSHSCKSRTVSRVSFLLLYTVKEKGGELDTKIYPLPYGLRNPYRSLKSENSQDYALNLNEIVLS
jgi:hypothetical protein